MRARSVIDGARQPYDQPSADHVHYLRENHNDAAHDQRDDH
jgi:hypothetical protein